MGQYVAVFHDPFESEDPEDQVRIAAFKVQADTLLGSVETVSANLAKVGVYVQNHQISQVPTPFGPRPALILSGTVGDIAFAKRTQDPETNEFDQRFKEIEKAEEIDGFLDARRGFEKALERDDDE